MAGGAPKAKGRGDGVVDGASAGFGAPNVNPDEAGVSAFSAGLLKENAEVGVGVATTGASLTGSFATSGDFAGAVSGVFGNGEVGLVLKPEKSGAWGALLASTGFFSSPARVLM